MAKDIFKEYGEGLKGVGIQPEVKEPERGQEVAIREKVNAKYGEDKEYLKEFNDRNIIMLNGVYKGEPQKMDLAVRKYTVKEKKKAESISKEVPEDVKIDLDLRKEISRIVRKATIKSLVISGLADLGAVVGGVATGGSLYLPSAIAQGAVSMGGDVVAIKSSFKEFDKVLAERLGVSMGELEQVYTTPSKTSKDRKREKLKNVKLSKLIFKNSLKKLPANFIPLLGVVITAVVVRMAVSEYCSESLTVVENNLRGEG